MCTVTPESLAEPAKLADYVDAVVRPIDKSYTSDELLDVGAALYRAGMFADARRRLEQALGQIAGGKPTADPMSEIFAHLFLAMAKVRLDAADEAAIDFATAAKLADAIQPSCWVDELQLVVLTAEAQAMLADAR